MNNNVITSDNINICYNLLNISDEGVKETAASILSMCQNTKSHLVIHIIHNKSLSEQQKAILIHIVKNCQQKIVFYATDYNKNTPISYIITVMPKEIERMIILKSDTIIAMDIAELHQQNTGRNGIAAVSELQATGVLSTSSLCENDFVNRDNYFNTDVLLLDIKTIRHEHKNMIQEAENFLSEHSECMNDEEEFLNYLFSDEYNRLIPKYNYLVPFYRSAKLDKLYKGIYNYVGEKKDIHDLASQLFYNYYDNVPLANHELKKETRPQLPEDIGLANFLPYNTAKVNILVLESEQYLPVIRMKLPRARIYSVNKEFNIRNNPSYSSLNINWVNLEFWNEPLDLPKESFDYILSAHVIQLVEDLSSFADKLRPILKQTGELLLTCPNTLHWQSIINLISKKNPPYNNRIWNGEIARSVISGVFYNHITLKPNMNPAPDEIKEKLLSLGYNNENNSLDISSWNIKAIKPNINTLQLKQHYSAKIRKTLTDILRRIEYGVDIEKNTKIIIDLWEKKHISADYMALYIRLIVVLHKKFFDNFIPVFIKENKLSMIQEMLQYFAKMNSPVNTEELKKWFQPIDKIELNEIKPKRRVIDCINQKNIPAEKKIAFISCVNNDDLYNEALVYINNIVVPDGYGVDIIDVRDGKSMCNGYNKGMKRTDAKYKVYLHQDCYLVNENFIEDMLKVFEDKSVGIMGAVGPKMLPSNGISWQGENYGALLHATDVELIFPYAAKNPEGIYEEVECVDGLMIATQYDIPWREDIFDNWHLYDTSHCFEMRRRGYKTAVPHQDFTWFIHCPPQRRLDPKYTGYQRRFLNEYSNELNINKKVQYDK